jgi:nondiscriminating glutamyl-tRNA synthetase
MNKDIRVRFAPSPTGYVHIGSLRTALFDYLIAKKYGGKFILRIEDTDQKRYVPGSVEKLIEAMHWAGIAPDEGVFLKEDISDSTSKKEHCVDAVTYPGICEVGDYGPYIQSERLDIYRKYVDELIAKGSAYPCFCTQERLEQLRKTQQTKKQAPMYDRCCAELSAEESAKKIAAGEPYVIRMKVPRGENLIFEDGIFGRISFATNTIDDQVLLKSDGFPTYHLAVVVDDHLMKITHITRGEEWLPSVPKHLLLYRFFGWDVPQMFHFPNILNQSRKKLSKREGDVSVDDFRKKGYLPEGLVNFLVLLGWNPKTEQEIFSLPELTKIFDEKKIHKAGAVFDKKKLDWINSHYIKQLSDDKLLELVLPYFQDYYKGKVMPEMKMLRNIVQVEKERIKKLADITENIDFYTNKPEYNPALLQWKQMTKDEVKKALQTAKEALEKISAEDFSLENIQTTLTQAAGEQRGQVLWPTRVALSGKDRSPSPFEIAWVIGKQETLERLNAAIKK